MTKPTRQSRTPRERAELALAVEERRVKRLDDRFEALKVEAEEVGADLAVAVLRRDYLSAHPDLGDPAPVATDAETVGEA